MALKDESGREPFSYLCLKQKRCSLTWSTLPCEAGRINYFKNNVDYDDAGEWGVFGLNTPVLGQPDNYGTNKAVSLVATGAAVGLFPLTDPGDNDFSPVMYWYIEAKKVSGDANYINITVNSGLGAKIIRFNLTNGSVSTNSFDTTEITAQANGWYKIVVGVNLANRSGPTSTYSLSLASDSGGSSPTAGASALIYGMMSTPVENSQFIEVTNGPETSPVVSGEQCFNTRQTCQDPDNYTEITEPIKFVSNRSPLLRDDYYIPSLKNVSVSPGELNPAGSNRSKNAIGKRALISIGFQDIIHNDRGQDPYLAFRDYDPLEKGTFWTKWRARNPFYLNTFIEYVTGYISQGQLLETTTRTFVMTNFDGPDANGNVSIRGKDILTLAEDTKAQAPVANSGSLSAAIDTSLSSFTLVPAGVGDLEYPFSGKMRIEKEIISFSRTGDTITPTARGIEGTTAASHEENAICQLCLEYTSLTYPDILYDLLLNYANIPDANLDKANWDTESANFQPTLYGTLISEPTSVSKLVGEMCEQMFFSIWWDERDALVKTKVVREAEGEDVTILTDDRNFIGDSISWSDKPDEMVNEAWVNYLQIDPTQKLDQESNFSSTEVIIDSQAQTNQGSRKIRKVYSRWITNTVAANQLAEAIVSRSASIPREMTFALDAKDGELWIGDFIQVQNRLVVDQFGDPEITNLQVTKSGETQVGTRFDYKAMQYLFSQPFDPGQNEIPIGTDLSNVNLRSYYESTLGPAPTSGTVTFRIRNGVTISGDSANYDQENIVTAARSTTNDTYNGGTSSISGQSIGTIPMLQRANVATPQTYPGGTFYPDPGGDLLDWELREFPTTIALTTGVWDPAVTLVLIIESGASIIGEGGNGSAHATQTVNGNPSLGAPFYDTVKGGDGGTALRSQHPVTITNNGRIWAGCGGGGSLALISALAVLMAPGGGGAGVVNSRVRDFIFEGSLTGVVIDSSAGSGSELVGGIGSKISRTPTGFSTERYNQATGQPAFSLEFNGNGGTLDQGNPEIPGNRATYSQDGVPGYIAVGQGGAAGNSVWETETITWDNFGDVRGNMI